MVKENRSESSWLRQTTEKLLKIRQLKELSKLSESKKLNLIQDLSVRQKALEIENEKLRLANSSLEIKAGERIVEFRKLNTHLTKELKKYASSQKRLKQSVLDYKKLYAYLQNVREEKRAKIARNVHDDFAQLLSAVRIELTSMKGKTDKLDFISNDSIDSILLLVDHCMISATSVIKELCPPILDESGLIPALKLLISGFQKHTGIICDIRIAGVLLPLNAEKAISVYRVIEETLANIQNHSKATYVTM
jgi:signal transduction histidine kinase